MEDIHSLPPERVPYRSELRGDGRIVGPKWPIAVVAMMAALMAVLDVSIVNVALPSIRASIGASLQDTSWISTGYIISNVIVIPMTGFFQRRIGYRGYFTASLIVFTTASFLCAMSWSLWSLVLFRFLQGLGGGALIPTASSIMLDRFPRDERNTAMAMFGLGAMMGPMLGPSLGGWLTDQFSWHMIFLINIPVGIVELGLFLWLLREDRSGIQQEPIDWAGIGLLAGWLSTMQYVLEEGNGEGWTDSGLIVGLSVFSLSCFVGFVWREVTAVHPVVKVGLFRDRQYTMGTMINMGLGLALFSGIYLFSLFCGAVLSYSAAQTGSVIFAAAILQGLTMPLAATLARRVDLRYLAGFGLAMMTLSLYLNTRFTGVEGYWDLLIPQLCRTFGMSFVFITVSTLALDRIEAKDVGDATGLFNLTRELGGSIGTAVLATLLTRRTTYHGTYLAESMDPSRLQARLDLMTAMFTQKVGDPSRAAMMAKASIEGMNSKQALVLAFNDGFALTTLVGVIMVAVVFTLQKPAKSSSGLAGGH
jgi:DHA2 family multidrug resistance protein